VSRGRGWALWDVASVPAALQFAASIAYGTIISFIAVVARERALDAVGVFFALLALSSLGVRLVAGKAYDKWGPVAVLAPAFVALVGGIILLAVTEGPRLFLLASVLAGLGIGGSHTTLISLVVDRAPGRNRASSVAGFAACWELGVGGGTIIMGRLAAALGFQVMFLVAAALPLLGLAGLRRLRDREEEGAQAPK
jgi:MFS family permease